MHALGRIATQFFLKIVLAKTIKLCIMYRMTLTQYQQGMNRIAGIRNSLTTARQELASEKNYDLRELHQAVINCLVVEMQETETLMNGMQNK